MASFSSIDELMEEYRDHALQNSREYKNVRECHIHPDWLLIYRTYKEEMIRLSSTKYPV